MRVEFLIYIYGIVCVSMILFNIVYNIYSKQNERWLKKKCIKLKKQLDIQLNSIRMRGKIEQNQLEFLRKKLSHINNLIAFEKVLSGEFNTGHSEEIKVYLREIKPVILYLALVYSQKETMQAGYFTHFISNFAVNQNMPIDSLQDILITYIKKDNLYCRINALSALYHLGNSEHVIKAVKAQDDGKIYLNEKILTEGLLAFTGSHDELIKGLWNNFNQFSDHTKLAVLNYIRFKSGNYKEEMLKIMLDLNAEKELRLSAIRYFGRYSYEKALEHILNFARNTDPLMWEYATVAVSALEKYEGDEVIYVLKRAIHSPNWYIRYSAAQSLEAHNLKYDALFDIISGSDRYAREMMKYRLESRRLRMEGEVR